MGLAKGVAVGDVHVHVGNGADVKTIAKIAGAAVQRQILMDSGTRRAIRAANRGLD